MPRSKKLLIGLVIAGATAVGTAATLAVAARPGASVGDTGELRMTGTPAWQRPGRGVPGDTQAALRMIQRSVGLHGR